MESSLSVGAHTEEAAALLKTLLGPKASGAATDFTAEDLDQQIPKDWAEGVPDVNFVVQSVNPDIMSIAKSHLNMLYGTSVSMVVSAYLKGLFRARLTQNPTSLLTDMLMAVFVSQTVSREWAKYYTRLGPETIFKQFEISSGRTPDAKVPASSWVANSKMNATALNLLGQMIMDSVEKSTPLGKKAAADGTIFNPVEKEVESLSEYQQITLARSKLITETDRNALEVFQTHGAVMIKAVSFILASSSADVDRMDAVLKKLKVKNF